MRRFVEGVAVIALALSANVSAATAQGVELSLGGGISNPLGTFNDATKLGWNGPAMWAGTDAHVLPCRNVMSLTWGEVAPR